MFDKNTGHFLFALSLVIIASYVGNNFKNQFTDSSNEYDMIKEYLLNESPLYGSNKPTHVFEYDFMMKITKYLHPNESN